jgi:hypothetical protein
MDAADAAIKPIIGLTTYLEQADTDGCGRARAAFLPETYLAPIVAAGGVPVLLPLATLHRQGGRTPSQHGGRAGDSWRLGCRPFSVRPEGPPGNRHAQG